MHYRLAPWLYTPSVALAYPYKSYPIDYFTNGMQGRRGGDLQADALEAVRQMTLILLGACTCH